MSSDRDDSNNREYTNGEVTVFWRPAKCIHATTCYKELISVFNPRNRPWVDMNGASTEEIVRVVKMCPTGALAYKYNEGDNKENDNTETSKKPEVEIPPGAEIRVMENGPLIVKGNFRITGSDGSEMRHMKMVSFCRCGHSNKMPFCDGTHRKINFSGT